ncbi:MAG TPA: OmpA family protein, partial [Candidatus Methanoperedens sp.]
MTGYGQAWLDAPFKVNADNKLDWTLPRPAVSNIGYGAMLVSPVPCTAAGNTVMISPTINSMGTIGTSMGTSGGVTVPGASAGATSGVTKGAVAGGIESRTYIVKVNVAPIPVESRTFTAYFDINSSKVEEASEISLASWYMSQLPVSMRKSIEDGVTTVWIRGHASTTNTIEYNRILSLNRAKKIENIL